MYTDQERKRIRDWWFLLTLALALDQRARVRENATLEGVLGDSNDVHILR